MAEIDFDEFEDAVYAPVRGDARAEQFSRLLNYAGAASSVALVILIGIWGYDLAMRDANGVPVMKALAGPMRVAPADPGGQEASNQGLSVNAIASTGKVTPVAGEVKLAPPVAGLTAADKPGMGEAASASAPAPVTAVPTPTNVATTPDAAPQSAPQPAPKPVAAFSIQAASVDSATISSGGVTKDAERPGHGLTRSLIPPPRPGSLIMPEHASLAVPTQIDPAKIAAGTQLVQLGAFASPEEAQAKWVSLAAGFSEVMHGKSLVIQSAESGGKPFYRLRAAGFDNEADARRFCAVLNAEQNDCTPVAQR